MSSTFSALCPVACVAVCVQYCMIKLFVREEVRYLRSLFVVEVCEEGLVVIVDCASESVIYVFSNS